MTETIVNLKFGRACGDCRLCCKVLEIYEIFKPKGEWCQHACSKGCGIYASRPEGCQAFECFWLANPVAEKTGAVLFKDDERPDKVKVVFCAASDSRTGTQVRHPQKKTMFPAWAAHESFPGAALGEKAQKVIKRLLELGIAVAVNSDTACRQIYYPPDEDGTALIYDVPAGSVDSKLTEPPGYVEMKLEAKKARQEGRPLPVWKLDTKG